MAVLVEYGTVDCSVDWNMDWNVLLVLKKDCERSERVHLVS